MPAPAWKNRIVGYEERDPADLKANPANWRMHPKAQAEALGGVLAEVGVVQNIVWNRRTGLMIDGHLRVELALKQKQGTVPVTVVDLSEEEERLILATLDPLGAMASANHERLAELLAEIEAKDDGVRNLLEHLGKSGDISLDGPAVSSDGPTRTFVFTLSDEQSRDIDASFAAARNEAPQGTSDDDLFYRFVTSCPED